MDIWMPFGVGILTAQRLKHIGLANVPVIFVTAGRKQDLWAIVEEVDPAGFFEKALRCQATGGHHRHVAHPNLPLPAVAKPCGPQRPCRIMKKILIIEDDEKIAFALCVRLKACGYATWIAGDGIAGLGLALRINPDLILLDISLPAGSGFSLIQQFNQLNETRETPIILATASKDASLRERPSNWAPRLASQTL